MTDRNLLIGSVIAALMIAAYTALSPSGLPEFLRRRGTADELKSQVHDLQGQAQELTTQVQALQDTGPRGVALIDKKAREELSLVGKGEIVLSVPAGNSLPTPSPRSPSLATSAPAAPAPGR